MLCFEFIEIMLMTNILSCTLFCFEHGSICGLGVQLPVYKCMLDYFVVSRLLSRVYYLQIRLSVYLAEQPHDLTVACPSVFYCV